MRMTNDFRTVLPTTAAPFGIDHGQRLLLLGSCFTEHIGQKLADRKFKACSNPFGIVYNPVSIAQGLKQLCDDDGEFRAEELFERDGLWHSWAHHGRFSKPDRQAALDGMNRAYREAATVLPLAKCLFLTLGTAEVSSLRESGTVVANNHKAPAAWFDQRRLTVGETVTELSEALEAVRAKNPDIRVVLSVSPVRHLRRGLIENQRSKAVLLLACAELAERFPFVHYFPAYELLLDDLRDYRFYAADMIHPSELAVDYVWQYFSASFFSEDTRRLNERIEKLRAAALHRPFHAGTAQHRAFVGAQLELVSALEREFGFLDFSFERGLLGDGGEGGPRI
jgi:hypothetical protein